MIDVVGAWMNTLCVILDRRPYIHGVAIHG